MKTVVLLSGKKGSGKTTTANTLPDNYESHAFANQLKRIVNTIIGMPSDWFTIDKNTVYNGMTYGQLLQKYGEFTRKTLGEDYFVDYLIDEIKQSNENFHVVHDLRYQNEMKKMEQAGFRLVKIRLFGRTSSDSRDPKHQSECDLDEYPDWDIMFNTEMFTPEQIADSILKMVRYGKVLVVK